MVVQGIMLSYLTVLSVEDIRKKQIKVFSLGLGAFIVLIALFLYTQPSLLERWIGALIGGIMLLIGFLSKGAIGAADSVIILYLGVLYGATFVLSVLCIASVICCLCCIIFLGFRIMNRKKRIPFIPFLFVGFIVNLLVEYSYV